MPASRAPPAKKRLTQSRLKNIALYYLQRYGTTVAHFRQVMRRRVRRELDGKDPADAFSWLEELIAEFVGKKALNDETYAAAKVARDRVNLKPAHKIRTGLMAKGVPRAIADDAVGKDDDAEWEAAMAVARRRRLGPYRIKARDRESDRRDLAALGRAGVPFTFAKRVIALGEPP